MENMIYRIGITVSNECNLNCEHCASKSEMDGYLMTKKDAKKVSEFVDKYRTSRTLQITGGGEPTLNIDAIIEICKNSTEYKKLRIRTNGMFLFDEIELDKTIKPLKKISDNFERIEFHISETRFHKAERGDIKEVITKVFDEDKNGFFKLKESLKLDPDSRLYFYVDFKLDTPDEEIIPRGKNGKFDPDLLEVTTCFFRYKDNPYGYIIHIDPRLNVCPCGYWSPYTVGNLKDGFEVIQKRLKKYAELVNGKGYLNGENYFCKKCNKIWEKLKEEIK